MKFNLKDNYNFDHFYEYDFENANKYLDFLCNRLPYNYRQWSLLDEYCFIWKWFYIVFKENPLWSNFSNWIVKRFKKLPEKLEDYFFGESYEKYCELMDY